MAVAAFFIFCISVVLFGLGFVVLTLRHHRRLEKERSRDASA
jgi:hypothetical protein